MKSAFKLIKRFTKALIFSVIILSLLNVVLLFSVTYTGVSNAGGWNAADELSKALTLSSDGVYTISESGREILKERNAWAILIEDKTETLSGKAIICQRKYPCTIQLRKFLIIHGDILKIIQPQLLL